MFLIEKLRDKNIETLIQRYDEKFHMPLWYLTRDNEYMGDLLESFPALAIAMATGYGSDVRREKALHMIKSGNRLRKVGEALGLPYWLRKAKPEAFCDAFGTLPCTPAFFRHGPETFPRNQEDIADWFRLVSESYMYGGANFAIWLAKQGKGVGYKKLLQTAFPLALYVWHSDQQKTYAGGLVEHRWNNKMGYDSAFSNALVWLKNVKIELAFGKAGVGDQMNFPDWWGKFAFVPLVAKQDLIDEGEIMEHCVGDYVEDVAAGSCRIFSVQQNRKRVATLEIAASEQDSSSFEIVEMLGRRNAEVHQNLWQVVSDWLVAFQPGAWSDTPSREVDQDVWGELWEPYWKDRGEVPLLPKQPMLSSLQEIESMLG